MARPTGCPPVAWQRKAGSYFSALWSAKNSIQTERLCNQQHSQTKKRTWCLTQFEM